MHVYIKYKHTFVFIYLFTYSKICSDIEELYLGKHIQISNTL